MRRDFVPKSCGYTRFTHVSLGLGDPRVRVWGCGCVGDWTCAWLKTSREQARGARAEALVRGTDLGPMRDQGGGLKLT